MSYLTKRVKARDTVDGKLAEPDAWVSAPDHEREINFLLPFYEVHTDQCDAALCGWEHCTCQPCSDCL